jgi:hypothetical protein
MMFATHLFDAPNWLSNPRNLWLRMIGRLKPEATIARAQAEMTVAFRQFHQEFVVPVANTELARRRAREAMIVLQPGHTGLMELGDTVRPTLFAVLGLVGLVMGIAFRRGRDFDARDAGSASRPVIVNENFVRNYIGSADPLGSHIIGNANVTFEIVGVVKDSANAGLRDLDQQMIYVPGGDGVLHVRAAIPPAILRTSIEEAVHRLDPDAPVFNVRTIEQQLERFTLRERTFAMLSSMFGLLALVLAAIGLYGVVANTVSRRTKELGIRWRSAPGHDVSCGWC